MTAGSLDKLKFSPSPGEQSPAHRRTAELLANRGARAMLEIGCGTGAGLMDLAQRFPRVRFVGLDFSEENIATARDGSSMIEWRLTDYLSSNTGKFDIICGESVLHLIDCTDNDLAEKLAADLLPGGVLVATMPYDCAWNRALMWMRHLLRAIRCGALDMAVLWFAKRIYPHWPESVLLERVEYLYIVPVRMDGSRFRAAMERCKLHVIEAKPLHSLSPAKPKHRLLVFERGAEP
jgi:SAM-dependent methyltransferase